jgi:FixJ family two-component response regulator
VPMSYRRRLVAIVDDDERVCRALKRLIIASNMEATTFLSGRAFLESLHVRPPDCVLLDFHMPDLTGEDVLKALARAGRGLRVIVISGRDDPANRAISFALGAVAYLPKPLDPAVLQAALVDALTGSADNNGFDPAI